MRDENIKEQLSRYAFCLMASRAGCKIRNFNLDDGVDLGFEKTISFALNGDAWKVSGFEPVDVQLKATTQRQVSVEEEFLKFDLKRKNFNDLIARKNLASQDRRTVSMILALLVLPDHPDEWLIVNRNAPSLLLNGAFYWYQPPGVELSKHKNWERVDVPLNNIIDLNFFVNYPNLIF